jgi:hypothetical protein
MAIVSSHVDIPDVDASEEEEEYDDHSVAPCPLRRVTSYASVEVQVLLNGGMCVFKLPYNVYCLLPYFGLQCIMKY